MSRDAESIEQVIHNYFRTYLNADPDGILDSFHEDTRLLTADNGRLEKTEMSDWIENLKQRRAKGDIRSAKTEIIGIEHVGDMAFVKASLQFDTFVFSDYLSLLKIDGFWKIVGKIYVTR